MAICTRDILNLFYFLVLIKSDIVYDCLSALLDPSRWI